MTYANGRIIHDADSHTMETGDWLSPYLDEELVKSLGPLYGDGKVGQRILGVIESAKGRKSDPLADAEASANVISGVKGWAGYGAFDVDERKKALDQLGFQSQLVYPTFGLALVKRTSSEDALYLAAEALNKAQAKFCASDPRLIFVAFTPLDNPVRALDLLEKAIALGVGAVMVPANAPGDERSPGHPDYDPFWAKLVAADIPFTLHIGPGTMTQPKAFQNNGRERAPDLHGGGENLRFADFLCVWYAPQIFLSALIYDGVFQRHPKLRGAVVECGAGWLPEFLRQVDHGYRSFKKTDPYLQQLEMKPSEYLRRAIKATPFPTEDVGRMIRDAGPELFLFSSDYPHPEGTADPMGRFEATMEGLDEDAKDRFYRRNFEELMGPALPQYATVAAE